MPARALRQRTTVAPDATDAEILRALRASASVDQESRQLLRQLVADVAELKQAKLVEQAETALDSGDAETFAGLVKSILASIQAEERAMAEKAMWEQVEGVNRAAGSSVSFEAAIEITVNYLTLFPNGAHYAEAQRLLGTLESRRAQAEAELKRRAEIEAARKEAEAQAAQARLAAEQERVRLATPWLAGTTRTDIALPGAQGLFSVVYAPDGKLVAVGTGAGSVILVDPASGKTARELGGASGAIHHLGFSPSGSHIIGVAADGRAYLWTTRGGQPLAILRHADDAIAAAAFSPDGKTIATGSSGGQFILWSGDGTTFLRKIAVPGPGEVSNSAGLVFTPDGKQLIAVKGAAGSGRLVFLDPAQSVELPGWGRPGTRPPIGMQRGSGKPVVAPDGSAFSPGDGIFYSARSKRRVCYLHDGARFVTSVAMSPDGRFAAMTENGVLLVFEAGCANGEEVDAKPPRYARQLAALDGAVFAVQGFAFAPDGKQIASISADGALTLWRDASTPR